MKWDLSEFKPKSGHEREAPESVMEKVVVLPGFELAQTKKKPTS